MFVPTSRVLMKLSDAIFPILSVSQRRIGFFLESDSTDWNPIPKNRPESLPSEALGDVHRGLETTILGLGLGLRGDWSNRVA
jgi:hypothetical protein